MKLFEGEEINWDEQKYRDTTLKSNAEMQLVNLKNGQLIAKMMNILSETNISSWMVYYFSCISD